MIWITTNCIIFSVYTKDIIEMHINHNDTWFPENPCEFFLMRIVTFYLLIVTFILRKIKAKTRDSCGWPQGRMGFYSSLPFMPNKFWLLWNISENLCARFELYSTYIGIWIFLFFIQFITIDSSLQSQILGRARQRGP